MLKKLEKWGEKAWEYVEDHEGIVTIGYVVLCAVILIVTFVSYTARTIVLAKAASKR